MSEGPNKRIEDVWDDLTLGGQIELYLAVLVVEKLGRVRDLMKRPQVRALFVAGILLSWGLLWFFGDQLPGRTVLLASYLLGAITAIAFISLFIPVGGKDKDGNDRHQK
jgi:hypothetical protein